MYTEAALCSGDRVNDGTDICLGYCPFLNVGQQTEVGRETLAGIYEVVDLGNVNVPPSKGDLSDDGRLQP